MAQGSLGKKNKIVQLRLRKQYLFRDVHLHKHTKHRNRVQNKHLTSMRPPSLKPEVLRYFRYPESEATLASVLEFLLGSTAQHSSLGFYHFTYLQVVLYNC